MTALAETKRLPLRSVALGLGISFLATALLAGGWLLWIALRPAPAGFAPTRGQAAGSVGQPSGVVQYTVDARSRRDWVYFSFEQGAVIAASRDATDWDLAFRRTDILTNGGETNPRGDGGAIDLGKIPPTGAAVPLDGYASDVAHEDRGLENPALHNWYRYNWTTHIITSKEHAYALRTAAGEVVLLTFVSYYCDDGSPGCVTFRFMLPGNQPPDDMTGRLPATPVATGP